MGDEYSNHQLLICDFARRGWEQLFKALDLKICLREEMGNWLLEVLFGWHFKGKAKILCGCVARALMWELFEDESKSFVDFCNLLFMDS